MNMEYEETDSGATRLTTICIGTVSVDAARSHIVKCENRMLRALSTFESMVAWAAQVGLSLNRPGQTKENKQSRFASLAEKQLRDETYAASAQLAAKLGFRIRPVAARQLLEASARAYEYASRAYKYGLVGGSAWRSIGETYEECIALLKPWMESNPSVHNCIDAVQSEVLGRAEIEKLSGPNARSLRRECAVRISTASALQSESVRLAGVASFGADKDAFIAISKRNLALKVAGYSEMLAVALQLDPDRSITTALAREWERARAAGDDGTQKFCEAWGKALSPWANACPPIRTPPSQSLHLDTASNDRPILLDQIRSDVAKAFATSTLDATIAAGTFPEYRLRVSYLDHRVHAELHRWRPSTARYTAPAAVRQVALQRDATARSVVEGEMRAAMAAAQQLGLSEWAPSEAEAYTWTTTDLRATLALARRSYSGSCSVLIEWQTPRPRVVTTIQAGCVKLSGSRRTNWFEISGGARVSGKDISLAALVRAVRTGAKYIELGPREFAEIGTKLVEILTPWANLEVVDGVLRVASLNALAISQQFSCVAGDLGREVTAMKSAMLEHVDLPAAAAHLNLHGYQQDGVRWMLRLSRWAPGCCLADDMGLGKTRQVLCVLAERASRGPALVVAPASLVEHWACGPDTALLASASGGLRFVQAADAAVGPGSVVVLSYDKAAKLSDLLAQRTWATVVYDEAHYLKNPGARRTKALLKVKADFTVAATGTPLENHIGEFWSIAQFFAPGWLGTRAEFRKRFLTSDEDQQKVEASALAKLLPLFVLRRRKSDHIASLPDLLEYHEEIEMHPDEAKQYGEKLMLADKAVQTTLATLPEAQKHIAALELLRQLREAAAHPSLVDDVHGDHSSKVDWLVEQLVQDREDGCKALVFSQWTRVLDRLERVLGARGVETTRLDGAMTQGRRAAAVRLIEDGRADVLLLTLGAGAVGLNLQAANRVYLFDPWWNPQKELQAICRAHRQGQRKEVVAIHMIAPRTVEQKLVELQGSKKDIFDAVMDGAEITLKLTTEEVLGLLDGRSFARR